MSGLVEGVVLFLLLAVAPPDGSKSELWFLNSMADCEIALRHAVSNGYATEGRCMPANIDLDAWAAAVGNEGAPL